MRRLVLALLLSAPVVQAAPPNPFVAPAPSPMGGGMPPPSGVPGMPAGMAQGMPPGPPPAPAGGIDAGKSGGVLESDLQSRLKQSMGVLDVVAVLDEQAMLSMPVTGGAPGAAVGPGFMQPGTVGGPAGGQAGVGSGAGKRRTWSVRHMTPFSLFGQRLLPVVSEGMVSLFLVDGPGAKDLKEIAQSGSAVFTGAVDGTGVALKAPVFVNEDPKVAERIRNVATGTATQGGGSSSASGGYVPGALPGGMR